MSSKRDDDSQADIDVGMTTAERRRRRRRGGGLRVPSDNVPRRTNPPVVAPVPEDPSLAMSIAYSFSSEASEPVPRVTVETPVPKFADPSAPEAAATVIDAPHTHIEAADFEMKTREMSAVDLKELGLDENGQSLTTTDPNLHLKFRRAERPAEIDVDVEVDADDEETTIGEAPPRAHKERGKTVALDDDDLEEVAESMRKDTTQRPMTSRVATQPSNPPPISAISGNAHTAVTKQMDAAKPLQGPPPKKPLEHLSKPSAIEKPVDTKTIDTSSKSISITTTQELTALDLERADEPMSVPEIDINELSDRAESSGEFEVDVDEEVSGPKSSGTDKSAAADDLFGAKHPPGQAPIGPTASTVPAAPRTRTPSAPPPIAPSGSSTNPGVPPPPPHKDHHHPPPPPTAQQKAPPAPPPKPTEKRSVPAPTPKPEPKSAKGKPWFVDLFDEDYLRTLPFLTPQATQAEAEFVIDAMGLSAGAQVLDVGCGYGRHAMELAARGFHVVGLDLSTPLLVRGGEEAHRRGLQINFVRGDMRELDFEAQFDGAYCLFSTFGYFDDETNKKTIANIARALKPGGRLMIEILNRDYVIADLPTRVWWEGEGCVVLEEVELNYFSSRVQVNRSVVFDDGRQLEQEISVRAYSLHEIGKLMHAAGFRVLEVSGGYHTRGRFFGNQSRHIIVLAERKDPAT